MSIYFKVFSSFFKCSPLGPTFCVNISKIPNLEEAVTIRVPTIALGLPLREHNIFRCTIYLLSVREGALYAVCCLTLFCNNVAVHVVWPYHIIVKGTICEKYFFPDKYQSQFGTGSQMFSYYHEEDESSFQLVDTSRPQRPLYQRNKNRFGQVFFIHCI